MIQQCSRVFMLSFLFLDLTLCTSFRESRRWLLIPECPEGTEFHCNHHHHSAIPDCDCITTPSTTPISTECSSDVNCSGFNCPMQQYPFCEPNLEGSACGCTECTDDHHCNCSTGMVGHCRDDTFERKCECRQMPDVNCKSDSDCSTHVCSGNFSQSFCHEKKVLVYDFSSCDCRECSKDSDCQCQPGLIPLCQNTVFGNVCHCKQINATTAPTHLTVATTAGLICPECDTNLTCVWDRSCYPGQVCMLQQYRRDPFTVHCSEKIDCLFMKKNMIGTEIICCEDHQCISNILPQT
ncbi:protein psiF-like isoform X2 [Crassostrea angulata]|uniref:protein psiF-like isoform X2 n=1 Tax=Magallana angulata TaxID=2784310 RepID=UPI0022B195AE|nr:protein psiF-like isoform X2 [Crassostrea angulata]